MMGCGHPGAVGLDALQPVGGEARRVIATVPTPLPAMGVQGVTIIPEVITNK